MTAITAAAIATATPGVILRDTEVPGLQLRANSDGTKTFTVYYRTVDGRERRPKLGMYGVLTLNDARRLARQMLLRVAEGEDPSSNRAALRDGPTMRDLVAKFRKKAAEKARSKNAATVLKIALNHIEEHLGHLKVASITVEDVEAMHAKMSRTTPTQANRVLAHVSMLLNLAEKYKMRPLGSNFCKLVARNPEAKRRRYLAPGDEAKAIGKALEKRLYGRDHEAALFIYLLLLTGARKDEIGMAKVEDLNGNTLTVRQHKTAASIGDKVIHFPDAAMSLLRDPLRMPHARNGFLVGVRDPKKAWATIRAEAGCPDLRMHDLRHTFASFGLGAGFNLSMVGSLLAHTSPDTTKRYAHLIDGAAKEAVNRIADGVSAALAGSKK